MPSRPKIDPNTKFTKNRLSVAVIGDAVTPNHPISGVSYYRVTGVDPVVGYYVGSKKAEDPKRPTVDIREHSGVGGREWRIIESGLKRDPKPAETKPEAAAPTSTPASTLAPEAKELEWSLVSKGGETNVMAVIPGVGIKGARDDHYNFAKIKAKLEANDVVGLAELFDVPKSIEIKFQRLSERITVKHGKIYQDNDPIDNSLTKQILKFLDEERDDWQPLVNFFEKVSANPSKNSRDQLHRFLDANDLDLTDDGDLIAYKGVKVENGKFFSTHQGPAIVNGKDVNGYVPNEIGSVIEMPRSTVVDNPSVHCSVGLHISTKSYAQSYGSRTLVVHVNPRDVVSVPTDSREKVRCCRYKVVKVAESR